MFPKIREDIQNSNCTTGINNTGSKFTAGDNDNGSHSFPEIYIDRRWHRQQSDNSGKKRQQCQKAYTLKTH